jgi:hypothetical protein
VVQFVAMAKTLDCGRTDFVREVSTHRKAVYLNFLFLGAIRLQCPRS